MKKTIVGFRVTTHRRQIYVALIFNRHVEVTDTTLCRRAFAKALQAIFSKRNIVIEHVDFEGRLSLPADHSEFPYNLTGTAERMHGGITDDELDDFTFEFERLLREIRGYSVKRERKKIHKKPRDDR